MKNELENRREFFKEAARISLPILGMAMIAAVTPNVLQSCKKPSTNCMNGCAGSCSNSCSGSCSTECTDGCKTTCKTTCKTGCTHACSNSCRTYCKAKSR